MAGKTRNKHYESPDSASPGDWSLGQTGTDNSQQLLAADFLGKERNTPDLVAAEDLL